MSKEGPQPKETYHDKRMRDISAEIDIEEQAWAAADMNHGQVTYHTMSQVARIDSIIEAIVGAGLISKEDLDYAYKVAILQQLREAREAYQPIVEQAKREHQIQIPTLLGPDGRKLA